MKIPQVNWSKVVIAAALIGAIAAISTGVGIAFGTEYGMIAGGTIVLADLWMASLKQGSHIERSSATRKPAR